MITLLTDFAAGMVIGELFSLVVDNIRVARALRVPAN